MTPFFALKYVAQRRLSVPHQDSARNNFQSSSLGTKPKHIRSRRAWTCVLAIRDRYSGNFFFSHGLDPNETLASGSSVDAK
jgi:hypothetical protein